MEYITLKEALTLEAKIALHGWLLNQSNIIAKVKEAYSHDVDKVNNCQKKLDNLAVKIELLAKAINQQADGFFKFSNDLPFNT